MGMVEFILHTQLRNVNDKLGKQKQQLITRGRVFITNDSVNNEDL